MSEDLPTRPCWHCGELFAAHLPRPGEHVRLCKGPNGQANRAGWSYEPDYETSKAPRAEPTEEAAAHRGEQSTLPARVRAARVRQAVYGAVLEQMTPGQPASWYAIAKVVAEAVLAALAAWEESGPC